MRQRSWIVRAIYQCPERVGVLLASTWLYKLQPEGFTLSKGKGDFCAYYPHYPTETISNN